MTNHRKIASLLLMFAIMGAGCSKNAVAPVASSSSSSDEPQVYLPPPPPPESDHDRNLREVRAAIQSFKDAKSFRAKLRIESGSGETTGQIDVTKPDRFHGTLLIASQNQNSEVIGVGADLYVHIPNAGWVKVSSPTLAKSLATAFTSALNGNDKTLTSVLPDPTDIKKIRDAARGCDAYAIPRVDDPTNTMTVCLNQGVLKYINAGFSGGSVDIEYFDYNALFTIERPTIQRP